MSGYNSLASGYRGTASGAYAAATGAGSSATGTFSKVIGYHATANGYLSYASGRHASAFGAHSYAGPGYNNNALGNGSDAFGGNGNTAVGGYAQAIGTNNTAVGYSSYAISPNALAVGANTSATASGSVAIGTNADGEGAFSDRENEFVLGTGDHTYTARGITSGLSRSRQTGPLEVVTSDAGGHLATDGGEIFKRLDEAESGIALAMSMEDPDLIGNERFGMRANYGNFEGASALSWTFAGVLGRDVLKPGDRTSLGGGFGVGFEEGQGDDVWGGRVGAQWTWGNAPAAYR